MDQRQESSLNSSGAARALLPQGAGLKEDMCGAYGEDRDPEQVGTDVVARQNSVAGIVGPALRRRSFRTAIMRAGVVQAAVLGLNGCVALLASAAGETGQGDPLGTLLTLNLVLLLTFLIADVVDRRRTVGPVPNRRMLQRSCLAGCVAAATVGWAEALSTQTGSVLLVALALLSCVYLLVSVGWYLRTERWETPSFLPCSALEVAQDP